MGVSYAVGPSAPALGGDGRAAPINAGFDPMGRVPGSCPIAEGRFRA
jgi:hypothetical protein